MRGAWEVQRLSDSKKRPVPSFPPIPSPFREQPEKEEKVIQASTPGGPTQPPQEWKEGAGRRWREAACAIPAGISSLPGRLQYTSLFV